ncbi:amidohydrolase family protein [Gimesia sp.]|uniref:amidohydrolase family protein n=1 Tax=Gimesia sp. TaxID=2024833 RepID=UPI0032EDCF01
MKFITSLYSLLTLIGMFVIPVQAQEYDLVIKNGRVIDPETGFDAVANVGIKDGTITEITKQAITGKRVINASGHVVAPGFIDFHAHGQNIPADRMQAFDGVTTALELESGILPVAAWYDNQRRSGRVLNYGVSAAWTYARVSAHEDLTPQPNLEWFQDAYALTHWVNDVSTDDQQKKILSMIERGIKEGSIGIGLNSGYAPGYGYKEVLAVHQLAAKYGVPTFTHIRNLSKVDPNSSVQAYGELISYATAAGSHVHICHLNSTSLSDISLAVRIIRDAQERGANISVEAYPYGAGSGAVNAAMFQPANMKRMDAKAKDIEYLGKPLTEEKLRQMQKESPGEIIVWHYYRLPRDQEYLDLAVLYPGGIIASDAMPWMSKKDGHIIKGKEWPLPDDAFAHPRTAATFVKFIIDYVRDRKAESLPAAIARCSYRPAKILESSVPQMKKKGRLQAGMDADIIVFNMDKLEVRATYTEPNQHTLGMQYVLVNGVPVIQEGELDVTVIPGQAVRRPVQE